MTLKDWHYIEHACSHHVTWVIPASGFPFGIMSRFPCPWCGGESGNPKTPGTADFVRMDMMTGEGYAFKGWAQTHKSLSGHAPIKPPYPASFTGRIK